MTLKIEAGKFYRMRNGRKAGPMEWLPAEDSEFYPWEAQYEREDGELLDGMWMPDGSCYADQEEHPRDLVAEWVDEPIPADLNDTVEQLAAEHDAEHDAEYAAYGCLQGILDDAYAQAARGKGKERHANDKPFNDQPIMEVGRIVGSGFALGQVMKKAGEAKGMADRGDADAAERELLGAIVYAAAAVLLIREGANAPKEG